jgi:hypothetical protein
MSHRVAASVKVDGEFVPAAVFVVEVGASTMAGADVILESPLAVE